MLVSQLINRVRQNLGDPSGDRYGDGLVLGLLQEAQRDIVRELGIVLRASGTLSADLAATPAYSVYTLPDDLLLVESIRYLGGRLDLVDISTAESLYSDWTTATGTPLYYMTGYWGPGKVRLLPYLTTAVDPQIYYTRRCKSLLDEDEPDIDPTFHDALHLMASYRILVSEPDADASMRDTYLGLYQNCLAQGRRFVAKGAVSTPRNQTRGSF